MKTIFASLIWVLVCFTLSPAADVDSLVSHLNRYQEIGDRSRQLELLLELAQIHGQRNEHEQAVDYYRAALRLCKPYEKEQIFRIYSDMGYACYWQDQYSKALIHLKHAMNMADEGIPISLQIKNLLRIAKVNVLLGNLEDAHRYKLDGLHMAEQNGDSIGIAEAYQVAFMIDEINHEFKDAQLNAQKALAYFGNKGEMEAVFSCIASLADFSMTLKEFELGNEYTQKALRFADSLNYPYGKGVSELLLGRIFENRKAYTEAEDHYKRSIDLFKQHEIKYEAVQISIVLAKLYALQGKYRSAISVLRKNLVIAKEISAIGFQRDIYRLLADYYRGQGIHDQAYVYAQHYADMKDSLLSAEVHNRIDSLTAQYEIQKREQKIERLEQQNNLQRNRLYLMGLGGMLVLLLIILWLLYSRYRLQKRNTEILAAKHREAELHNQQLAITNSDLSYFSDIVSHDLRFALEQVNDDLKIVEDSKEILSDPAQRMAVERLSQNTNQMGQVLSSLFMYSAAGIRDEGDETIDLGDIVREVIRNLPHTSRGLGSRINIQNLPIIRANRRKITQLFQHLIANALKYRSDETPEIKISCTQVSCPYNGEPEYMISIQDNGVGISEEKKKQLFHLNYDPAAFTENRSTSIGLVVCRKIVEQYRGSIWVDSELGKGSTFHFVLPLAEILPTKEMQENNLQQETPDPALLEKNGSIHATTNTLNMDK